MIFTLLMAVGEVFSATSYLNYGSALAASQQDGKPMVVAFTASWCGPCSKMKSSTLSDTEVKKELEDNFHFYLMDVDEQKALSKKFGISSLPTLKVIDKTEKELDSQEGFQSKGEFLNWIRKYKKK